MASCGGSVNCSDLFTPVPITVLPDIVGIGIITSFSLTAAAAFGALLYSYFTDSLSPGSLSWADWGFLQKYHVCKSCRIRYGAAKKKGRLLKACKHNEPEYDTQRREGVTAFVLTLSDQQLVTGPAMIIAALVQHCQLSVYEFQVVNCLAWFSSTTHLATLTMLQHYLMENKVVRNIRVVAMSLNLGLLIYTTIISNVAYVDNSAKIQCVMDLRQPLDLLPNTLDFANVIIAILFLLVQYGQAITRLYSQDTIDSLFSTWLRVYCCNRQEGPGLGEIGFKEWYESEVNQSPRRPGSDARRRHFWSRATAAKESKRSRSGQILLTALAAWIDFRQSFLGTIPALLMSFSYAITQLVYTRMSKPDIQNSENLVDFGQIVPIFLLALPLLAFIEMYYETHPDRAEENHGSLRNIGPKLRRLRRKPFKKTAPKPQQSSIPSESSAIELEYIRPKVSVRELDKEDLDDNSVSTTGSSTLNDLPAKPTVEDVNLSLYMRRDAQIYLNVFFWVNAAFSTTTGVMLWINAPFSITWSVLEIISLLAGAIDYCFFAYSVRQKARVWKKSNDKTLKLVDQSYFAIQPSSLSLQPQREKAPASSTTGLQPSAPAIQDTRMSGALTSESPEVVPAAGNGEVDDFVIQIDGEPRRRQTYESVNEDQGVAGRIFERTDTESNLGLEARPITH